MKNKLAHQIAFAIMKVSLIPLLLLLSIMCAYASRSSAQKLLEQKVTVSFKEKEINKVFAALEQLSEIRFVYSPELIQSSRKVTLEAKNEALGTVLKRLLDPLHITYELANHYLILQKKLQEQIGMQDDATVQQPPIKGKVTSATGEPLAGVTIGVKGTTTGTTTDTKGEFSLMVPSAQSVLVISYIGYQGQEITAGTKDFLDIKLVPAESQLSDVIVVGYGTTTRKNLTTAISKIDPKKVPAAANNSIPQLLFGRAAGLQVVQQSSEPGGDINISIRGRGNPLVVVDGIVYPYSGLEPDNSSSIELQGVHRGGLAGINPADIESIEILKDASAAIYGVNAANGVMLITTKKGKAGRMNVSYEGSRSLVKNMPYLKPLNATEYMTYYNQFSKDKYLADRQMSPFGPNTPAGFVPRFSDAQIQSAGTGTNWLNQVLRTGSVDNHTLNINGGTEKVVYYFSGNYFNQAGTMKNSGLQRYNGRMNMNFNFNKHLTLNTSLNANRTNYTNSTAGWQAGGSGNQGFGALQAALAYPAYLPVKDSSGNYTLFAVTGNPVSLLDISDKTTFNNLLANISLDINIIPGVLSGKLLYGNNYESSVREFYIPSNVFWGQIYRSRGSLGEARRQNQTMEATLSFRKSFGTLLNLDAVAGTGQYLEDGMGFTMEAFDVLDAINLDNLGAATGPKTVSSYKYRNKTRSYFARSTFDFLDRYVVTLAYRYDGADKFFPDQKFAAFPSASVAWKMSNESFLKQAGFLGLLKLRASYGITGNLNDLGTSAYGVYKPDDNAITFNNGATVYIPYLQTAFNNPNLTWPQTKSFDVGLDFELFNNRISGSIDWFYDDITRLIKTNANTAPLSYISTSAINGGRQVRKGYEFSLNTFNVQSKNFSWNTILNITHFDFRWKERFPNDDIRQYQQITDPVNAVFVYRTNGILQVGQTVPAWQPAGATLAGACILVMSGCKKNFDAQLPGTLSPSNFPKTEADFEIYTLEVYKPFGAKWGYNDVVGWQNNFFSYEYGHIQMFDAPTDLFSVFTSWGGFFEFFSKANFNFLKTQNRTGHFEKVRFITRTTKIIGDLEKAGISDDKKNQLLGEAKMARGWAMFYLLHMYGPVPVILDPAKIGTDAEYDLTRPARAAYVEAIAQDLRFAADHLEKSPADYGRFNNGLALTVLMRLYLNEKDFPKAEQAGREIQALGYSLVSDYGSLFREATEKNNETIYAAVDPNATGNNLQGNFNAWAFYCYPSDMKGIKMNGGWGSPDGVYAATWPFYDSFDPADKRRALLIAAYTNKSGQLRDRSNMAGAVVKKYPDETGAELQGNDIPMARYADVMLMLAEAINQNNGPTAEAQQLVNEVRSRAGLGDLPAAATASKQALNDAILEERGWELYFEGVRKMDLVRHGKWQAALQAVGKTPGPDLFPVPQYAIDASDGKLTQTAGY